MKLYVVVVLNRRSHFSSLSHFRVCVDSISAAAHSLHDPDIFMDIFTLCKKMKNFSHSENRSSFLLILPQWWYFLPARSLAPLPHTFLAFAVVDGKNLSFLSSNLLLIEKYAATTTREREWEGPRSRKRERVGRLFLHFHRESNQWRT